MLNVDNIPQSVTSNSTIGQYIGWTGQYWAEDTGIKGTEPIAADGTPLSTEVSFHTTSCDVARCSFIFGHKPW